MTSKSMNDLEKAQIFLSDKNVKLVDVARKYNIPYQTLKNWRADPEKLKKSAWERVHLLAKLYDLKNHK
jgi:hypothetical protein